MRLFKYWKRTLALAAIFVLGMGTGAVGSVALIIQWMTRHEGLPHWTNARVGELDHRLHLTPEQKEKLRPIVARAGERSQAIGAQTFEQILTASQEARDEIAKELTPEQQKEFDKLQPQVIAKLRGWVDKEMIIREREKNASPPVPK